MTLAKERLGMTALEGDVYIDRLADFSEAGACGTAAIISPIGGIQNGTDFHVFYSETEVDQWLSNYMMNWLAYSLVTKKRQKAGL